MKNQQKRIFCLTRFVSGREKNAHFRAHYLFWKAVFCWKHYFYSVFRKIVFSENTAFQKQICMLNKTEIYEKYWVVFEHGKMVFFGFLFWGFNVIVVSFGCVWHSSKSVQNACFFPSFGGFCGVGYFVYLGLEGLGVLVFLCLFFFFYVGFVSVLFVLFLFSCWIVFGVGSCFVFVFFFLFCFCFFVCFCLFLFFLFILFFWRV